jgi:hypothetical protein
MERREHEQGGAEWLWRSLSHLLRPPGSTCQILSAGCDIGFPVPRGHVSMQGRKQPRPLGATTP